MLSAGRNGSSRGEPEARARASVAGFELQIDVPQYAAEVAGVRHDLARHTCKS